MILTSLEGQSDLPRYFATVFARIKDLPRGQLDIHLPDGRQFRIRGAQDGYVATLHIHDKDVFARLIREGDLGFCESYMDGGWSTPDLQAFLDFVHDAGDEVFDGFAPPKLVQMWENFRFWMQRNTKAQAKKNISAHYDLGNDFYALWLDRTMTYSSALFVTGDEDLAQAQMQKYASMVDRMGVQAGDHVLEIGCGWGGFAEYAAKERGLRVTCLTISREQLKFAKERIEKAGLSSQVEIKFQDYRDENGVYDGIASIEMFEAVGEAFWPSYFDTLKRCLKPGAQAVLQIITVQDRRFEIYRQSVDFIQKYIFPGGMLPSPSVLRQQGQRAGLEIVGSIEFGESYSKTLRLWHETFNEVWPQVAKLGFDERFRRMWNFYLTACAATFHSGNCDITQITMKRP